MYMLILNNDKWHIVWFSPRYFVSWRKWFFATFFFTSEDKHKRYNWR